MKRTLISVGMWLLALNAMGQDKDVYVRKRLSVRDIQVLYSHYVQDGIHSAVTGGQGTENLKVYASSIGLQAFKDSATKYFFRGGADVITSASTDKIDFVVSSASRVDYRGHASLQVTRELPGRISAAVAAGISMESDYLSRQFAFSFSTTSRDELRTFSTDFQGFIDDLRWGRLNPGYYRPVKLIYPSELRGRQWHSQTNRNSFTLNLALKQVISRRMIIRVFAGSSLQSGLLSTPFHRVYFADSAHLRVEKLPSTRWRMPLGFEIRWFAGQRTILKIEPSGYWDSFGIRALGIQAEGVVKITPMFSVSLFGRVYSQQQARYFKPYAQHTSDQEFYTSDFDLAQIQTIKVGGGLRYAPFAVWGRRLQWKEIDLRYSHYRRSDGLYANAVTLLVGFGIGNRR